MFIREQIGNPYRTMQYAVATETEFLDIWIWSPVSCRHTNWTFEPKRGRVDWYAQQQGDLK